MARLLSILLQRSDPGYPWGFTVRGGLQERNPLTIDQVKPGTLAAQYLAPGDTILQIDKADARLLWPSQVESMISQPSKSLDLLILKGQARGQYSSSDSGSASSTGGDPRARKQNFWERVGSDKQDTREGFTGMEGVSSPFKERQARLDRWRRCQSEEKSNTRLEDFSDSDSHSSRVQSVWSPTPDRLRKPNADYQSQGGKMNHSNERQGDITFWEVSPDRESADSRSARSGSLNTVYKRHNSDFSYEPSSLASEYASTPKSNFTPVSPYDMDASFMRKPSDFWGDHYRDQQSRVRFGNVTPSTNSDNVFTRSNISSKSEFKKSTTISEKSYSSAEGAKSFETYEQVNKTKEVEKSSKTVDGGKEEVVEKTKKNKEYILANKDDRNGQPQETKKVINDFKVVERVMDGENEFCNKVKERSEEVTNSSTPVNFYDNVQQQGVAEGPSAQRAEWCDHSVNRQKAGQMPDSGSRSAQVGSEESSMSFSPLLDRDSGRRWASSTPLPDTRPYEVYKQEEPLIKNYFEVDIRSPRDTQLVYSTTEEILRRQSSQLSGGGSPVPATPPGDVQAAPPPPPLPLSCPPAPPPPPPPGLSGSIPTVRLSSEIPDKRRSAYEPPAAIQNAMMTKDKKPFTYTPGGLDLSEIRSPRMARRISRNANAPDLAPQPRPSPLSTQPLPPSAVAAMQPQIAVAVLPQGGGGGVSQLHHVTPGGHTPPPPPPPQLKSHPISPPVQTMPSPPPPPAQPSSPQQPPQRMLNRQPSPPPMAVPKLQPQHRHTKSEPQSTPGSIYVPPIEPQQARSQLGSLYIPPLAPQEPTKPQSPVSQLNKAPTPWMSRQTQQPQKEVPPWVTRDSVQSPGPQQQQTRIIPIQVEGRDPSQPNTRIIPIQLEGTPSPQHTSQPPSYSPQQSYQQQQQQQQYQQQQQQYQQQYQQYQQQQSYDQQQNQGRQTPRWMNQQPVYVHNKFNSGAQSPVPAEQSEHTQSNGTMQSPGPVQSRSFKVLEKITGTDHGGMDQGDAPYNSQGVPLSQLRKLQLSDDDRALMNKVKSQVDDETYLHNESDPRYRGSAIPSRAFRILQTMTDTAEDSDVPRAYSPVQAGQNRLAANRTAQPDAPQQYVPPSEQQVQEPRKYTGGAIPSRSFRMLQAMTAGSEPSDRPGESEY